MAETAQGRVRSGFDYLRAMFSDSTILLIVAVIGIVSILIVPLPIIFLDFFQIVNILLALMIMLTVLNAKRVLDFSTFPTVLLLTTIFRLAVNVSATRLILTEGEGFSGKVISAFANFVVGGNYLVGFIIFVVITAVLFMVITKGATRVSEVSARFQLDAMPQKQLAIDTELSQGLINEAEAKKKRELIQMEAAFYGNMDGASKFVSGDVRVGVIITIINIVGGIITGMVLRSESFDSALQSYVMLSIGDGLVSQIPTLLISTASGIIVTRNISETKLGDDVKTQILADPLTLYMAGGFVFVLAFLPGFPMGVFFFTAGLLFFLAYAIQRGAKRRDEAQAKKERLEKERQEKEGEEDAYNPEKIGESLYVDQLELEIGYNLIPLVDEKAGGDLLDRIKKMRKQIAFDYGLVVPQIRLTDNMKLEPEEYEIKLGGVKIAGGMLQVGKLLALPPSSEVVIEGEKTVEPVFGLTAYWINDAKKDEVERLGCNIFDGSTIIATHMTESIKKHAGEILTRKEVQNILDGAAKRSSALMDEFKKLGIKLGEAQKVFQMLLSEGVSIRNVDLILEAICDYYSPGVNFFDLYEGVRYSLRRQISAQYADKENKINVISFSPNIENELRTMVSPVENGYALNLAPALHQKLVSVLSDKIASVREKGYQEILLVDREVRLPLKRLLASSLPSLTVLSFFDMADNYKINMVETV